MNPKAALKTGLAMGILFSVFGGGTPWSGAVTFNMVMGRPMAWPWWLVVIANIALAIGYLFILSNAIYRFKLVPSIFLGVAVAAVLYLINSAIFFAIPSPDPMAPDRSILVHLIFGLFGSAIYKALSVPPPRNTPHPA